VSAALQRRLVTVLLFVLAAAALPPAGARGATLAPTPYMGWDSYYGLGGAINERLIVAEADALVNDGLRAAGYRYVWLDVGWWGGRRNRRGSIVVDRRAWPHGIAWLAAYVHARGLLLGLYTDAGRDGCGGRGVGSLGHYAADANQFAAWGVDAVKVDFCGGQRAGLDPARAYALFSYALRGNRLGRPILLDVCNGFEPGQAGHGQPSYPRSVFASWQYAPRIATSWRTGGDIGFAHHVIFSDVLRNLDWDAAHPEAAGPGHWNDPDYLAPAEGMSLVQAQTQFTMWAMLAAPLMVSSDLRTLSPALAEMLANRRVIAVDQDPAGRQAVLVGRAGAGEVWARPLAGGAVAVALLNRGAQPLQLATSATQVGLPAAGVYTITDLWSGRSDPSPGPLSVAVPGDGAALFTIAPA
jgi:alpha-galactosidase